MSFRGNILDIIAPSRSTSQVPDEIEEAEEEEEEDNFVPVPTSKKKLFGGIMGEPIRIKDDEENSQEIAAFQGRKDLQAGGMVHPGIMNLMELETTGVSTVTMPVPESPTAQEGNAPSLKREPSARTKYILATKVSPSVNEEVAAAPSSSGTSTAPLSPEKTSPLATQKSEEKPSGCCTIS
jgi:hypothetical protein